MSTITASATSFAEDVRAGLTLPGQKELPSKYLYDALGSKLFEAICELPYYGVTRADERVLNSNAGEIVDKMRGEVIVAELGSGNGRKTRAILEALAGRGSTTYYPIEISSDALADCRRALADIDSVGIVGLETEFIEGLIEVTARRKAGQRLLVLFLGSTIGNFSPPADLEFLSDIRSLLRSGDGLLLGTDLVKPIAQLEEAYADPLGVTGAFNLNLLVRINRELDADFDLRQFEHLARFNQGTSSIEMHIRSRRAQTVTIHGSDITVRFAAGETIWTENSRKYTMESVRALAQAGRFLVGASWIDREWPFAESLLCVP